MTSIDVAAWLLSSVVVKASVVATGLMFAVRLGMGHGAWGLGSVLAGVIALLSPLMPSLGPGYISVPHDALQSFALGPISVSPVAAFVSLWVAGAFILLLRLVGELQRAAALVRAGRHPGPRAERLLVRAAAVIGCVRIPELRESSALASAALIGLRKPVLLLPTGAREWSDEELFGVLCHELEHARRMDWLLLMIERVVQAVFWINPLVHIMTRQAAAARELVADEAALRAGTPATVYAGRLIAVARDLHATPKMAASVAFAAGGVEQRVRALFDGRRRPDATNASVVMMSLVVLPLFLALAAFEPWTCLP